MDHVIGAYSSSGDNEPTGSGLAEMDSRLERALTMRLNLIGESEKWQSVIEIIHRYAASLAPVLLLGETGTGKEQIARAIHYLGVQHGMPFIAVNCGALPDNLIENELFGHVQGAFTDAGEARRGLIEQAEGGSLFLDEIEALSPKGQVVLLRFLQDYEYRPLGCEQIRKANLRLIAATNQPLAQRSEAGLFRRDLFFRLNILALEVPPLRERAGDVRLLAEHFVDKYRGIYRQFDKFLDPRSLAWMLRYEWPGNVRELENLIQRGFLLADDPRIAIEAPLSECGGERRRNGPDRRLRELYSRNLQDAKSAVVSRFEQSYLRHVLRNARGNISKAAKQAGKERRSFVRLLEKHGLFSDQGWP